MYLLKITSSHLILLRKSHRKLFDFNFVSILTMSIQILFKYNEESYYHIMVYHRTV